MGAEVSRDRGRADHAVHRGPIVACWCVQRAVAQGAGNGPAPLAEHADVHSRRVAQLCVHDDVRRRRHPKHRSISRVHLGHMAAIICNASVGITVSAVLKYCDNIARVYAHSIAMLVVMLVSVPLFGLDLTAQLIIAVLLVIASTLQYNIPIEYDSKFDQIEEEAPKTV